MGDLFRLVTEYELKGDQPQAVDELCLGIARGDAHQVLLGVTGSGKTFTVANVIARCDRPALIIAPNKTLAAQLFEEFHELFPDNAVEYFVSYYDYYQPEAYVPASDTYIEKDSLVNERIDRLRHAATHSLLTRRDVIIVASGSSCRGEWSLDDRTYEAVCTGLGGSDPTCTCNEYLRPGGDPRGEPTTESSCTPQARMSREWWRQPRAAALGSKTKRKSSRHAEPRHGCRMPRDGLPGRVRAPLSGDRRPVRDRTRDRAGPALRALASTETA